MRITTSAQTLGTTRKREVPEAVVGSDTSVLWWQASDLGLANNASISTSLLNVNRVERVAGDSEPVDFEDKGNTPTCDVGTMARPSMDCDASGTLESGGWDARGILPGASEALLVAAVIRMPDVTDHGQFGVCGSGAYGVSNSGFRGVDWLIYDSDLHFRMKGQDNGTKSATISSGVITGDLTNNHTHVCIGVREHGTNKVHVWLDGPSHDDSTFTNHYLQNMKHDTTAAVLNLGDRTGGYNAWSLNGFLGEMIWLTRSDDFTNSIVNHIGTYLSNKWGAEQAWIDVTQLAG